MIDNVLSLSLWLNLMMNSMMIMSAVQKSEKVTLMAQMADFKPP